MKGSASACASATVVNAISTGKGAAFAIDLRVSAEVSLEEDKQEIFGRVGGSSEDPLLIETCVKKVLEFYGVLEDYGAEVSTTTEVPIAVGLSSSSAAANATVLATSAALGEDLDPNKAVSLGVEAAFEANATITGAYDDASASFYGGGVVTNNREQVLLERFTIDPSLNILIYVPAGRSYTKDVDVDRTRLVSELVDFAHEEAISGNPHGAQTVNGLVYSSVLDYDPRPALNALEAGALSAGLTGTGPATVAISEDKNVEKIENVWRENASEIIVTKPSEEGARKENE